MCMVIFDLSVGDLHWANIYLLVYLVAEGICCFAW